jgi:hypothetical protein
MAPGRMLATVSVEALYLGKASTGPDIAENAP